MTFRALLGQFEHDLKQGLWKLVAPTEALLLEVHVLFRRLQPSVFLRSLDALHLATAKAFRASLTAPPVQRADAEAQEAGVGAFIEVGPDSRGLT